jgi:hypothetical protein
MELHLVDFIIRKLGQNWIKRGGQVMQDTEADFAAGAATCR